ncbi:hypothetical protein LJC17_01500 [Acholeplasma sp. OttesenSCG-928-E16]|nr:hypothetical protein [Acholeplasma sp. OttesenSCG-928-E16]
MYWTATRIKDRLSIWTIFGNRNLGFIYYITDEKFYSIYGIDIVNKENSDDSLRKLLLHLNALAITNNMEHIYYFAEPGERKILEECGYDFLTRYTCLKKTIS